MADAPDPSTQSAEAVRKALAEPEPKGAAAVDFGAGPEPKTSTSPYVMAAAEALTTALGSSMARADAVTSELATGEIAGTIERGTDPVDALTLARSSGLVPDEQLDQLAWDAAVAEAGYTPEEYDDDDLIDDETDQAIEARYQQILGESQGMAEVVQEYDQQDRAAQASLQQQLANHETSVAAMKTFASELGLSKAEWEAHLAAVDRGLEDGMVGGRPVNLDQVAATNPELFDRYLRYGSGMLRQVMDEEVARPIKDGILAQEARSVSAGMTNDGVQTRPVFASEPDPEQTMVGAAQRALTVPRQKIGELLPPERPSVRDGFTVDGKATHPDDVPIADAEGGTARSRLDEELRRQA